MKATGERVIIRLGAPEEKRGALYLPARTESNVGVVVAVGPKCEVVGVGNKVIVDPQKCGRFEFNGEELLVTLEGHLMAVL